MHTLLKALILCLFERNYLWKPQFKVAMNFMNFKDFHAI